MGFLHREKKIMDLFKRLAAILFPPGFVLIVTMTMKTTNAKPGNKIVASL